MRALFCRYSYVANLEDSSASDSGHRYPAHYAVLEYKLNKPAQSPNAGGTTVTAMSLETLANG